MRHNTNIRPEKDRRHKTGDVKQTGNMRQETGDRRRETVDVRQETEVMRQGTENTKTGDMRQEM